MKHKPMLLTKINSINIAAGRISIGLLGTHHGTGVTYTSLMLAFYLAEELGKRTALIECNKHHDMMLIEEAYEWSRSDVVKFSFQNLSCYKEFTPEQVPTIYGEDYDALVLDFGTDFHVSLHEFLRCNIKIVVAGRAPWELIKLKNFYEVTKHISGSSNWIYLIQQADIKTIQSLSSEMGCKVMSIPATSDPIMPSRSINRFFSMLLRM